MSNFEIIAELEDVSMARVLVTALRAHGFHPPEGSETGLPGMPGITGISGKFPVLVPEAEAADAKILADSLIAGMNHPDRPQ